MGDLATFCLLSIFSFADKAIYRNHNFRNFHKS